MTQKSQRPKLLLLLLGIILGLCLLEAGFRVRQWMKYGTAKIAVARQFHIDAQTGLRVPAVGASTQAIWINSQGFRSPELDHPKPPGRVRLAFLGASTTFCSEVSSNEHTWPHLVWRALQDAYPAVAIDYVNAAVPGYTLSSTIRNLEQRVKPLAPDIIVFYEAQNELAAESRLLAKQQGIYAGWGDEEDWLSKISLSWYLIKKNIVLITRTRKAKKGIKSLAVEQQELSRNFRTNLLSFVEASKEVASHVAIPTFSYKVRREQTPAEQIEAAKIALYYMPYMSLSGLLDAYEEYNRVIREVAQETGGLLIDGELTIPADDKHFTDSFHFTDEGSAFMARRVAAALLQSEAIQHFFRTRMTH